MRRSPLAWLLALCVCCLPMRAQAQAPSNAPLSGGVWAPPVVTPGQLFQVGFSLRETSGTPLTFDALALAVLGAGGTFIHDAVLTGTVTLAAGGHLHVTDTTRLPATVPLGDYTVVARGRYNGIWFDFPAGAAQNPRPLRVETAAFAAVVPALAAPARVPLGTRPGLLATVRNTSTANSGYNGDASFVVDARVTRGGTVVGEQTWPLERFAFDERREGFVFTQALDTSTPGQYLVKYRVRTYSSNPSDLRDTFAVREASFVVFDPAVASARDERPAPALHAAAHGAAVRVRYDLAGRAGGTVRLYDLLGRERAHEDVFGAGTVDLGGADGAGVYLVRLTSDGGAAATRTVVVR